MNESQPEFRTVAELEAAEQATGGESLREQFEDVLADFGETVKLPLALGEDGTATFTVDDEIVVSLQYLDESDVVIAFAPVGAFGGTTEPPNHPTTEPPNQSAGEKALELLRLNELGGPTGGFALALDEDADLVLAMDRRSVLEIAAADSFAAWMEALVCAVRAVRERFAEKFPAGEEA
jgi:hypothetical protein